MTTRPGDIATYIGAIALTALFIMPLAWLASLSLRTPQEVHLGAARFIPEEPTWENFRLILTDRAFGLYLYNAVKLCALGAVAIATPAAYAVSRFRFRGSSALMIGILAVQMISPLVLIIPLYRYMDRLGLLEKHGSVIALYMALGVPLSLWLIKSAFDAIPLALEEAAAIDGCGRSKSCCASPCHLPPRRWPRPSSST